jgi:LAGLIDADG endonuclease
MARCSFDEQLEQAWCAGFFDGEGSIHYYRRGARRTIQLNIAQRTSNREVLDRCQAIIGGRISHAHTGISHLQITNIDEIKRAFAKISPWLGTVKKRDFIVAIALYDSHRMYGRKERCPNCKVEWNQVVCDNCGQQSV